MAAQDPTDDIDEGIYDSYLMKMDVLDRDAMGDGFRFRQSVEDGLTTRLDRGRERAVQENVPNTGERQRLPESVLNHHVDLNRRKGTALYLTFA